MRGAFSIPPPPEGGSTGDDRRRDRPQGLVLGIGIDRVSCEAAAGLVCDWAAAGASRAVLAANVHMAMEAVDDASFRKVMAEADLIVADGQPLAWTLKARGYRDAHHVRGQDLVLSVCAQAESRDLSIGLYGTTDDVLDAARRNLQGSFPGIRITYAYAPPFRPLAEAEDLEVIEAINASKTQILLVAIGCPKQEKWIAAHVGRVEAVMIGAGAAVDMIGGRQPVAPRWMQASGLEWLFRLASDPERLWLRYAKHNLRFLALVALETLGKPSACRPGPPRRNG